VQRQLGIFAVALLLPIVTFTAFVFWQIAISEREQIEQEAEDASRNLALMIDGEVLQLRSALQVLSASVNLRNGDLEAFDLQAREIIARSDSDYEVVLRAPDGQQLVNTRLPFGQSLPRTPTENDAKLLETESVVASGLIFGEVAGAPIYALSLTVREGEAPRYFLSLSNKTERLSELLARAGLAQSWTVALIDRTGRIMARNNQHAEFVGAFATDDLQQAIASGPQGTWNGTTQEGTPVFGTFARSDLTGWTVATGVPEAELNAPVRRTLVYIIGIGVLSLALSIFLATIFGRRISRPVTELALMADAFGKGERPQPLASRIREFNQVAEILGRSARQLAAREGQLRESEARFRAIADTMPQMVWSTTVDGLHDYFNARWYEFIGAPAGSTDGESWKDVFHPEDQKRAWDRWQHSLRTGEPYEIEYRLRHHTGVYRWTLGRALPIRDESGRITRWFGTCTDIHEAKQQTQALELAQLRLKLAVEAAAIGVWEYEVATDRVVWDERIRARAARQAEEINYYSQNFLPLVHLDDRERVDAAIQATARDGKDLAIEYRINTPVETGDVWVASHGLQLVGDDGQVKVIGTARNITEEKRQLAEREVIAQELSHRIKNIFSVISGMIGLSARAHPETRVLADELRARIAALGRAHDFVRPHEVSSRPAVGPSTLAGLAHALLSPYEEEGSDKRFVVSGADIDIDDRAATPLALLFHELATNAAKYGALSVQGGKVHLDIAADDEYVTLDWRESGGPPIAEAPERKGFGSRLTSLSVEQQLSGSIERLWSPDGLHCRVMIPRRSFSRTTLAA
jgi:PAS domain S-box-containing protein